MRKLFSTFVAGAFVALFAFVVVQLIVVEGAKRAVYAAEDVPAASLIIVPGASVLASGKPSDILADRLTVAADLYAAGKADTILVSGDNGQDAYDEVNAMRVFLLNEGVAPENIFLDHAGFDTYDTMYRANRVFGVTDAIVVTQGYHLPRALFLASKLGIEAAGVPSDLQPYVKQDWFTFREMFARVKAFFEATFGAEPTYLGEPIDIEGDGRVTWDEGISSP